MKIFPIFFLTFLFISPALKADNKEYVSYDLLSSYNHQTSKELRKNFDILFENYNANRVDFDLLKLNKKQIKRLQEKFIILGVNSGEFGGYFFTIIFSQKNTSHKFYIWKIWLYDISGNNEEFEIRSIKVLDVK